MRNTPVNVLPDCYQKSTETKISVLSLYRQVLGQVKGYISIDVICDYSFLFFFPNPVFEIFLYFKFIWPGHQSI